MLKLVLFVVLALVAAGVGIGAGQYLHQKSASSTPAAVEDPTVATKNAGEAPLSNSAPNTAVETEFARLSNQFVVPVIKEERVNALVALTISLEVPLGRRDAVLAQEPKIQDAFLQVLFSHANSGGFLGSFTEAETVLTLRRALLEKGQSVLGADVVDVLITAMARQDS